MSKYDEHVYSTDKSINNVCKRCNKIQLSCTCPKAVPSVDRSKIKPLLRFEKAHRGGKEVTIIERLPANNDFLKDLAQKLKKRCGCGGTHKIIDQAGRIEIQGDKRDAVKKELLTLGFSCK